ELREDPMNSAYSCRRGLGFACAEWRPGRLHGERLQNQRLQNRGGVMLQKLAIFLGIILAFGVLTVGQEVRSEITVSGTGLFTKDTSNNSLQHKATETGGMQAGYRINLNRWAAAELNYGYARNSQKFFTGTSSMTGTLTDRIHSNIHQATADFVA